MKSRDYFPRNGILRTATGITGTRNIMNNFVAPQDACSTYKLMLQELEEFMDALFEHIHIENNILFPRFIDLETNCVK